MSEERLLRRKEQLEREQRFIKKKKKNAKNYLSRSKCLFYAGGKAKTAADV